MTKQLTHAWFFYGLLLGTTAVMFLLIQPFLSALVLAFTLAIVFDPINNYLVKNLWGNRTLASILTLALIGLVVIIPLFWFGWQILDQGRELYAQYFTADLETPGTEAGAIIENIRDQIDTWIPWLDLSYEGLDQVQAEAMKWLIANLNIIFTNTIKIAFNSLILLLALFFLLRDMPRFFTNLEKISPLGKTQHQEVIEKIKTTINSVMTGSLLIAFLQGLAVALGFAIFNISQPIFWGGIGMVLSLIPGVGPIIVLLPAAILLYLGGNTFGAIGMIIWAILIVSLIDNLLRPILIERDIKLHSFFILLAALGGIGFFGPIGFVLGPVILSLFFALLDIYINYEKELTSK